VCVLKQPRCPICSCCPVLSAFYRMTLFLLFARCSQPLLEAERIDMVDVREHVDKVQGCVCACMFVSVPVSVCVSVCVCALGAFHASGGRSNGLI
jgi:hypothetical protein